MQKIAVILLVCLLSACHKEFVSTNENQEIFEIRNAIMDMVPAAEVEELSWDELEPIKSDKAVMGYKIPFNNNTATSYSFILANYSNNEVGGLYKNTIGYTSIQGGLYLYPITISNYNYSTHETTEYDTRKPIDQTAVKMGNWMPMGMLPVGLHLPAVTTCGVFEKENEQGNTPSKLDTYILGYLLGFNDDLGVNTSKSKELPSINYYDPLSTIKREKDRKAVIAWDIFQ